MLTQILLRLGPAMSAANSEMGMGLNETPEAVLSRNFVHIVYLHR